MNTPKHITASIVINQLKQASDKTILQITGIDGMVRLGDVALDEIKQNWVDRNGISFVIEGKLGASQIHTTVSRQYLIENLEDN